MTWRIREFRTGSIVETAASFDEGFQRCIRLYLISDRRKSYYVEEVPA